MSMMRDFFTKLEPMQKRHIAGLTLFPLKASVKCDLENIKTFDELADLDGSSPTTQNPMTEEEKQMPRANNRQSQRPSAHNPKKK